MEGLLLDVDYAEELPAMKLFVKKGKETIIALDPSFRPYFYVAAEDPEKLAKLIPKLEVEEKGTRIKPLSMEILNRTFLRKQLKVIKLSFERPGHATEFRRAVRGLPGVQETYEFDIQPSRRYLVDTGLIPLSGVQIEGKLEEENGMKVMKPVKPPKVTAPPRAELNLMSFDIEVYNPSGTPRADRDPVIMISMADNHGFRRVLTWKNFEAGLDYVEVLKDEREMLERFLTLVKERDADILFSYNGDLFDFPYLRKRADGLKVKLTLGRDGSIVTAGKRRFATATRVRGRPHIDVFSMVHFLSTIGNIKLIHYTLEDVYKYLTGKEKPDFDFMLIPETWDEGGKKAKSLLEYSLSDARATLEIGVQLLPLFTHLTQITGQSIFDVTRMTPGQLVEWLMIAEAHRRGELVPPRPVGEEYMERAEETYTGAYVMEPAKGLHENLVEFDFRSLYPSLIVSLNISPDTFNCDCCRGDESKVPELGYHFCKKRKGFVPAMLEKLIQERVEVKKRIKQHDRESPEYRSLDAQQTALKIIANSFYGSLGYPRARWYSKESAESVASFGRRYINETIKMARDFGFDVIYADTDGFYSKLNGKNRKDALEFLERVNRNLPGIMELELEGFYPRGIFITKKRYAVIDGEGRITVRGLEFVRRDWAALAKKTQEKVLEAILKEGSPKKAAEIIRAATKRIQEGEVELEDLIIYTQLKMPIESYRSVGPHVVAAKRLRERGVNVEPGMMIAYVVTMGPGSISERSVPIDEFKEGMKYDADYYVGHQVLPAVMRIMEVLGYHEEDLRFQREKQMRLSKFFEK